MALSEKTLLEMEAGARALAKFNSDDLMSAEQMENTLKIAHRYAQYQKWERDGLISTEWILCYPYIVRENGRPQRFRQIHCGSLVFTDRDAEEHGSFPSELLIAQIALALAAGQDKKG